MGTRGVQSRASAWGLAADRASAIRRVLLASLTLLAGCSSLASLSPGPNQPVSAASAPAPSVAAATDDQSREYGPYPNRSITDVFKQDWNDAKTAPGAAGTLTGVAGSDNLYAPYPKQTLISLFQDSPSSSPNQPAANVPRPPSTYTASASPYTPPPGQQTYNPPAGSAPQTASNVPRPPDTYTASASPYTPPPGQQTYNRPGAPPPAAQTAAAPTSSDDTNFGPYPNKSLFDIFSGK